MPVNGVLYTTVSLWCEDQMNRVTSLKAKILEQEEETKLLSVCFRKQTKPSVWDPKVPHTLETVQQKTIIKKTSMPSGHPKEK